MYDAPKAAVNPANALWDPAFNADFTGGKTGNDSYAHVQPAGARKDAVEAVVARDAAPPLRLCRRRAGQTASRFSAPCRGNRSAGGAPV